MWGRPADSRTPRSLRSRAGPPERRSTRLKKIADGQTTKYFLDVEMAPDGTVTRYGIGGKAVGMEIFIHHRDHLGSIQGVTDSTGAIVRHQAHKPFGDQHSAIGSYYESKG